MITSKQRSFLKSLAHNIDPAVYIGKAGVTENVVKEIDSNDSLFVAKLAGEAAWRNCIDSSDNIKKILN